MNTYDISLPSSRILFALEALKEFEAKPGCRGDMDSFHKYEDNTCFACLAGAAALKYYNIIEDDYKDIDDAVSIAAKAGVGELEVRHFEFSLDCAIAGYIGLMVCHLKLPPREGHKFDRDIADYHKDRKAFYADMHQLATDLAADGY